MDGKNSYETSWADQWDPDPLYTATTTSNTGKKSSGLLGGGGGAAKVGKKMEKGLVKTKDATVTGMKKIKAGASVGFGWIKDKYHRHKANPKH